MIREGNTFTPETTAEELRERVRERMWRDVPIYFADRADDIIRIVLEFAAEAAGSSEAAEHIRALAPVDKTINEADQPRESP